MLKRRTSPHGSNDRVKGPMASRTDLEELAGIAELRAYGRAQGWPIPQIVEAIGVSRLKARRLARGWTRPQAVQEILKTYDVDGLARPSLTPQRLCAWDTIRGSARARTIWIGCAACMKPDPTSLATATTTPAPPARGDHAPRSAGSSHRMRHRRRAGRRIRWNPGSATRPHGRRARRR
jgi:hypothetical protein